MSTLVVVESPTKEKTIAKLLGPGYIVRSTMGHIADLIKTAKNKFGIDIENGFKPHYVTISGKRDRVKAIVDAAKQCDQVYLAADPDREGEAIAWHVADAIKGTKKPVKRVLFHEITKKGVTEGVSNPGDLNKHLYDSQQARRVLDRLVGFMVSPYLWNAFGGNLSAGRVQSVCLRLIVDREREIESFVPEVYWNISATLKKAKAKENFVAKYPKRITDEKKAKAIKSDLDKSTFTISDIESKEQKRNPYPPLTTSKMQQSASARFRFSTKKTMSTAQSLYEGGHVTYIRTDSTRSSPQAVADVREWLKAAKHKVPKTPNVYKTKGTAQDAHEAIRPTDVSLKPSDFIGTDDQKKLYRLVWERFVASQMLPALYDTMAVTVKASTGHELKANGRTLKYTGWLAVCAILDKEEDVELPPLSVGDTVVLTPPNIVSEKKQTQPPPRYSEGALVKELEKRGIGRPSTYAAIIGKISDRSYVTKSKNVFTPTEIGCKITDDLKKHFMFMEYEYTKLMEEKLDKIEVGDLEYVKMLTEFFEPFKTQLRAAQQSLNKDGGQDCDKCGKRMVLKHGKFGHFIACPGYPDCKNTIGVELDGDKISIRKSHEIADGVECPKCNSEMILKHGKFGQFCSCIKYPKCDGTKQVPFGKKCPKCNNELTLSIFKDKMRLNCMGYPNCKHVEDPPPGTKLKYIDPSKPKKTKKNKKVEKILNEGS